MFVCKLSKLLFLVLFIVTLYSYSSIASTVQTNKANVVFISVASQDDSFWNGVHRLAETAAEDLNINLEILLSNRNRIKAVDIAKELTQREHKPDYVIVVAEMLIASKSIPLLANSGIKVFLIGSLTKKEKILIGEPRQIYPNYIGKISLDDYMAGYLSAELMIEEAIRKNMTDKDGYINILSLEGVRKTSFNSERVRGLNEVLKNYSQVRILQSITTDWSYEYAFNILPLFLKRYSKYKIGAVWCANSALSQAVSEVFKSFGKTPGVDFITVGTDWDINALTSVENSDVLGIAGGHVASLAWAVILIHDYHNGIDFDSTVFQTKATIVDKKSAHYYMKLFITKDLHLLDFSQFSKEKNPLINRYDFNLTKILTE